MSGFQQGLFLYIIIILSAIIHEYAHGWMAYREGDPTAKYAGRLTLNPIVHMELFGTVLLPLALLLTTNMFFGYAKPVPINPNNFKDQRRGLILTSAAGPLSNLLIAVILGMVIRFFPGLTISPLIAYIVFINIWLALFNLLPVPPLDGSKLLFGLASGRAGRAVDFLQGTGSWLGIVVALLLAFTFLPALSNIIFKLIIGSGFSF
ncbi:MAG: site-2 protease family protein [Candidatus Portnoybacteria bacterium]|nr:site-2 protease family protein [Candidatus Portnoybacteria bacterium]